MAKFVTIGERLSTTAPAVNKAWLIISLGGTVVVSVAKNMKDDER